MLKIVKKWHEKYRIAPKAKLPRNQKTPSVAPAEKQSATAQKRGALLPREANEKPERSEGRKREFRNEINGVFEKSRNEVFGRSGGFAPARSERKTRAQRRAKTRISERN